MNNIEFKAYVICNEIDLNEIASECGIPKKFTWEEPLILKGAVLSRVLDKQTFENQAVHIFSFGSVVFSNCTRFEENTCLKFIKNIRPNIQVDDFKYQDDYILHVEDSGEIELTDKYVTVNSCELYQPELVATVIAKSVALEKIEEEMMEIMDDVEPLLDRQQKGRLRIRERRLGAIRSRISRYQYNTIAYIMILDKPDVTWIKGEAETFYDLLSEFFELNDRYQIITQKTELLNNVMEGVASMSRLTKNMFFEVSIVVLILAEVIIMLIELMR